MVGVVGGRAMVGICFIVVVVGGVGFVDNGTCYVVLFVVRCLLLVAGWRCRSSFCE